MEKQLALEKREIEAFEERWLWEEFCETDEFWNIVYNI